MASPRSSRSPRDPLGVLVDLVGTWHGDGFNQIFLPLNKVKTSSPALPPSATDPSFFRMFNAIEETLEFTPNIGPVKNRGFGDQEDIDLQGLRYLQTVVDRDTRDELHVEPGFFLSVPPTHTPSAGPSLVRQGVIPHGCSILMHGDAVTKLTPDIGDTSTTPMFKDGSLVPPGYLALAPTPDLPAGIPHGADVNPNVVLQAALAEQERRGEKVESTVKLTFKTGDGPTGAGISNIAFLQPDPARVDGKRNNAAVTHVSSTFWLQRVRTAAGAIVLQLQYSQTVLINFDQSINWPHVTVATLRKVVTPTPPARLPVPAPASRPAPFVLGSGPSPAFDRVPPSPHAAPPFTPPSH